MSEPKKYQAFLDWHAGHLTLSSAGGKNEPIFLIERRAYESAIDERDTLQARVQFLESEAKLSDLVIQKYEEELKRTEAQLREALSKIEYLESFE